MVSLVDKVTNLRITDSEPLPSPARLCEEIPRSTEQKSLVARSRDQMHALIHGADKRLLAVVGPCSIHDLDACREYAGKFAELSGELEERLPPSGLCGSAEVDGLKDPGERNNWAELPPELDAWQKKTKTPIPELLNPECVLR